LEPLITTVAILLAMGVVVLAFRSFVRRPAKVTCEDPPGVRTVALCSGDDAELFADDDPDGPLVGVRLFSAICSGLATAGVEVENRGTIQYAQRAECVVGPDRFALVLERAENLWVVGIEWVPQSAAERRHLALTNQVFSPPDGPSLRHLLMAVDRLLRAQPMLGGVRWHRKEDWVAEDTTDPADSPVSVGE
jgi:hypothetical protein